MIFEEKIDGDDGYKRRRYQNEDGAGRDSRGLRDESGKNGDMES
jgi:hypothetical protein